MKDIIVGLFTSLAEAKTALEKDAFNDLQHLTDLPVHDSIPEQHILAIRKNFKDAHDIRVHYYAKCNCCEATGNKCGSISLVSESLFDLVARNPDTELNKLGVLAKRLTQQGEQQ